MVSTNILNVFFMYFRYLHFYNRYMNHMQSLKFEHKLYNCIKEKMEEMQQHNMSWIEVRFSRKAKEFTIKGKRNFLKLNYLYWTISGAIFETGRGHFVPMPANAHVYICFRVLFAEK